jgi:hypothetical protein
MLEADPGLKLVGSGALGRINHKHDPDEKRTWSRGMLEECASRMDYIAEHFYEGRQPGDLGRRSGRRRRADVHFVFGRATCRRRRRWRPVASAAAAFECGVGIGGIEFIRRAGDEQHVARP